MKAILMSIQPKWCELIASGKKTVEVRKTRPKIETPFKVYIYATQGKFKDLGVIGHSMYLKRQKVIGEFVCNEIECFTTDYRADDKQNERISKQSCVPMIDLMEYEINVHCLYGWHISNLKIYDMPKEIYEFSKPCDKINACYLCKWWEKEVMICTQPPITRPPQSWCYVEAL